MEEEEGGVDGLAALEAGDDGLGVEGLETSFGGRSLDVSGGVGVASAGSEFPVEVGVFGVGM